MFAKYEVVGLESAGILVLLNSEIGNLGKSVK